MVSSGRSVIGKGLNDIFCGFHCRTDKTLPAPDVGVTTLHNPVSLEFVNAGSGGPPIGNYQPYGPRASRSIGRTPGLRTVGFDIFMHQNGSI